MWVKKSSISLMPNQGLLFRIMETKGVLATSETWSLKKKFMTKTKSCTGKRHMFLCTTGTLLCIKLPTP